MFEKIKIKATLASGKPWRSGGNNIVSVLATFISDGLTKKEVDRLQGILKVIEIGDQASEKLVLNNVYLKPAVEPTPSSNAVLAERIVELDRRLSQYMDVGKSHVESINGLIDEVTRLRGENLKLTTQAELCRESKEDSERVIENFRKKTHGMEDDLATYEKRHAAMQAKVLDLQEENRVMDNLIAVKQKDLAHYTEVIADLKHICSGYSGKIDALEKQVALQSSHAASLENQLVDRVRALDIQSSNVASLNRKYSSVRQYLVNFRDAFNRYTGSVDGSEFQRNAVANLQKLLAMYPEIVETDSDKTTSAVEWQAPAERGTEGY
jgi:chromosome segregation ATPase